MNITGERVEEDFSAAEAAASKKRTAPTELLSRKPVQAATSIRRNRFLPVFRYRIPFPVSGWKFCKLCRMEHGTAQDDNLFSLKLISPGGGRRKEARGGGNKGKIKKKEKKVLPLFSPLTPGKVRKNLRKSNKKWL